MVNNKGKRKPPTKALKTKGWFGSCPRQPYQFGHAIFLATNSVALNSPTCWQKNAVLIDIGLGQAKILVPNQTTTRAHRRANFLVRPALAQIETGPKPTHDK
jgi:hypothetical protein